MKRLAIAALLVAALPLASAASASNKLVGKYTTVITKPAAFKGTWVLSFKKGGAYTVVANGRQLIRGRYTTTGSKITFGHETGDGACTKTGAYTWAKTGKTLRFTRVSDSPVCNARSRVLAHTFTQKL